MNVPKILTEMINDLRDFKLSVFQHKIYLLILLRVISDDGIWKNKDVERLFREHLKPQNISRLLNFDAFRSRHGYAELQDDLCSISILLLVRIYFLKKT